MTHRTRWMFLKWVPVLLVALVLTLIFSRILAPSWDLYGLFYPAVRDVWQGQFSYAKAELFTNPPWTLVLLLPMGFVSPAVAHGALVTATLLAMFWVMRDYRKFRISYPLAVISMPMLSLLWVGQLEVFSLVGTLSAYRAVTERKWWLMAIGLLFMTVKPQETFVLVLLMVVGTIRRWSWAEWGKIGLVVGGVAFATSVWLGFGWLERIWHGPSYVAGWQNFSLWQLQEHVPTWMIVVILTLIAVATVWSLRQTGASRAGIAIGAVASNLLSPYLTEPHLLMTLCFGWGFLFDQSQRWGTLAYLASLTPLLRLTSGDQSLNQLDLIFPVVVFVGLLTEVPAQRHRNLGERAA